MGDKLFRGSVHQLLPLEVRRMMREKERKNALQSTFREERSQSFREWVFVALKIAHAFTILLLQMAKAVGCRASIQIPLCDPPMQFTP